MWNIIDKSKTLIQLSIVNCKDHAMILYTYTLYYYYSSIRFHISDNLMEKNHITHKMICRGRIDFRTEREVFIIDKPTDKCVRITIIIYRLTRQPDDLIVLTLRQHIQCKNKWLKYILMRYAYRYMIILLKMDKTRKTNV